ncbi:hypothetical protein P5673_007871 [Acropora cervicornis]|uniref:Uncharacterized protein n=1 Tax=Acropora cervicornis TaxID=6130 RepID=A0AAD9QV60_ACRCE|nr:hypothetical protein P5673_007871 [Acropora cervicornis]
MVKILFHGSSSNGIEQGSTALEYAQDTTICKPRVSICYYLYFIPRANHTCDYLTQVGVDEVDIAEEDCAKEPSLRGCSPYFNELAERIMED